jgi:class 3 adenylate cyclase
VPPPGAPRRVRGAAASVSPSPGFFRGAHEGRNALSHGQRQRRGAPPRLVLFADLVGFTTFAEGRDAEDTRELLTRYFELARDVIGRYGGTSRSSSATP